MKGIIVTTICIPLICGCTAMNKGRIIKEYDRFNDKHYCEVTQNVLSGGGLLGAKIYFNPMRVSKADTVLYMIELGYVGDDWLFIQDGESMTLLIDGVPKKLYSPDGSLTFRETARSIDGIKVRERAIYLVGLEDIIEIAEGDVVDIRIDGSSYFTERNLSDVNKKAIREFLMECCDVQL